MSHDTSYHRPSRRFPLHASYRSYTALRTSSHQSIRSCPIHASCCSATLPRIFYSCTIHKHLNMPTHTFPMDLVIQEFSFIIASVQKLQHPLPILCPIPIFSFVFLPIQPFLHPQSILLIVLPLPDILGPIRMSVGPFTISLIIQPFSFIHVPIRMIEYALTIGLITLPLSHVLTSVSPCLSPRTLSHGLLPASLICYTIIQLYRRKLHDFLSIESRGNGSVVLLGLTTIEKIGVRIIYFSIFVCLWFDLQLILFGCSSMILSNSLDLDFLLYDCTFRVI